MSNMHDLPARRQASADQHEETPTTPFDLFLSRAGARRRARVERGTTVGAWSAPDPRGCADLPHGSHPLDTLLARRKAGASRNGTRWSVRIATALLLELDTRAATDDQVRSYPWHHVDADLAAAFRDRVALRYPNPGSRNPVVDALRQMVTECRRAGLISRERAAEVLDKLPNFAPPARRAGRRLTLDEQAELLRTDCESTEELRVRNRALLALMLTTGMRVGEVCWLDVADYDRTGRSLLLSRTKTGRQRAVPVAAVLEPMLQAWLDIRGDSEGPLFWSVRGHGRLGTHGVRLALAFRARIAGIGEVRPHDLRRTVASTLLRHHDPSLVARLLGHNHLASTLVYDLSTTEELRRAVDGLPIASIDEEGQA